ncbi:hypothetical protein [Streptomyces decoyicus]|uniref:hypothetical protein n=1 Tax=Streptomyces decoyicus TaxID=249567 RepID=UPI00386E19FB
MDIIETQTALPDGLAEQSAYNKRLNAAGPQLSQVIEALARQVPTWNDDLRLIDSTPLPCAASRETTKRSEPAGHAGYGFCRSNSRFFWGLRLYLLTTAEGMPVSWCLANPKLGEREVMTALLERDHHLVRTGRRRHLAAGAPGRLTQEARPVPLLAAPWPGVPARAVRPGRRRPFPARAIAWLRRYAQARQVAARQRPSGCAVRIIGLQSNACRRHGPQPAA